MNKATVLGMLDALETMVLDGRSIPLTDYVVCDTKKVLMLVSQLRTNIQQLPDETLPTETMETQSTATKIRQEANAYADQVLSKLLLVVTKVQKHVVGMERTLETSRELLHEQENHHESKES